LLSLKKVVAEDNIGANVQLATLRHTVDASTFELTCDFAL